jgi:hypothetical protein
MDKVSRGVGWPRQNRKQSLPFGLKKSHVCSSRSIGEVDLPLPLPLALFALSMANRLMGASVVSFFSSNGRKVFWKSDVLDATARRTRKCSASTLRREVRKEVRRRRVKQVRDVHATVVRAGRLTGAAGFLKNEAIVAACLFLT